MTDPSVDKGFTDVKRSGITTAFAGILRAKSGVASGEGVGLQPCSECPVPPPNPETIDKPWICVMTRMPINAVSLPFPEMELARRYHCLGIQHFQWYNPMMSRDGRLSYPIPACAPTRIVV